MRVISRISAAPLALLPSWRCRLQCNRVLDRGCFHLQHTEMQILRWILLTAWAGIAIAAAAKKNTKKASDPNDNKGLTPFFLQDPQDQMCLGPHGFTNCDENALWILTRRVGKKTYSLVSLLSPDKHICLSREKTFFGLISTDKLALGPCNSNVAKSWQWDFVDQEHVQLSNQGHCLVRGKKGYKNTISLQSCKKSGSLALAYQPTSVHENGFYIKGADGMCFDGNRFRSCIGGKNLWGIGVKYSWTGVANRYVFNFALTERNTCLVVSGKGQVGVGSCSSPSALSWGMGAGALTYSYGAKCMARKEDDTAWMAPCKVSEYVALDVPSVYTQEQLGEMLNSETLTKEERTALVEALQRRGSLVASH